MEGQRFPKSIFSLEDIHQQIVSLRRENRFLKFGLVFCLIIATLPYLAGFQPETIRAKRLITEKVEFVRKGQTVLSTGVHPIANSLVIWGKGVKPLVFLGDGEGGGILGVYNKDGNPVAAMDAGENGGVVGVTDKNCNPVASMRATENGGAVSICNKDGNPVASMHVIKDGGVIVLTDKKGNLKWSAP